MFKQMSEEEVEQLIADSLAEKRRAQHKLFKQFYGTAFAVCMRYAKGEEEAQDMLNEGFIKVFANLQKFQNKPEGSFEAWLKRVVVNAAIDYQRRYKTLVQMADYEDISEFELPTIVQNDAIAKMSADEIILLIQKLPPMTRSVFNLYVFEGLPHAEIAKILDMKEGTSHWHLNFARSKLKEMLSNK